MEQQIDDATAWRTKGSSRSTTSPAAAAATGRGGGDPVAEPATMAPPLPAATTMAAPLAAAPAKKTSSGRSRGKRSVKKSLEKRSHVHARSKNGGVAVLDAVELEAIKKSAFDEGVAVGVARGEARLKASKAASMQNLMREGEGT